MKKAIAKIQDSAWEKIKYTNAVFDEESNTWISDAEVAEIGFTAFISKKKEDRVTGRLVVRRVPQLNPKAVTGQETLFDTTGFTRSSPPSRRTSWTPSRRTRSTAPTQ